MVWSLEISIKAAEGESIEEFEDVDKEISIWKRGKERKEELSKSPIVLIDTLNNGLMDFLQSHVDKIDGSFSNVFEKSTVEVLISINGGRQKRTEITATELKTILSNEYIYELNLAIADDKFIGVKLLEYTNSKDSLLITNRLVGYKVANEKQFLAFWNIEVEFNKYDYLIRGSANFSIKKKYSQVITEKERQEIVNQSLKELFTHIKEQESKN